jgi:hypothetical protein
MRLGKLDQLKVDLDQIIDLADKVGYDSTTLKSYQQKLLMFKQDTPPPPDIC